METLVLKYIGEDDWSRPIYRDDKGIVFKDTNLGDGPLDLCTVSGLYGEPDTPIRYIEKYKNVKIEVIGEPDRPTPAEKFNYQLLSRLQMDCDYFLGNGGRHEKHLWAGNVKDQIQKMKELWESFAADKKPEWLTWDEILTYESKMTG